MADALSQNFSSDYNRILKAVRKAIADKRVDDFILSARVDHVVNGMIFPAAQGLYMPVDAVGAAKFSFRRAAGTNFSLGMPG